MHNLPGIMYFQKYSSPPPGECMVAPLAQPEYFRTYSQRSADYAFDQTTEGTSYKSISQLFLCYSHKQSYH